MKGGIAAIAGLLILALAVAGCGGSSGTSSSGSSPATTSSSGSSPATTSSSGSSPATTTVPYQVPTEAQIGIPFYTGAPVDVAGTQRDYKAVNNGKFQNQSLVDLTIPNGTQQTFDQVSAWYEQQLSGKPGYDRTEVPANKEVSCTYDEGDYHKEVDVIQYDPVNNPRPDDSSFSGVVIEITSIKTN